MSEFFKGFLSREIVSLTVMLAVLLARFVFRRAPKRLTVALWAVVCFRLLCPVSIDAPVSLVPKAAEQAANAVEDLPASDELATLRQRSRSHYIVNHNDRALTARQWSNLALELAPSNITVNAVAPGYIDTKMNAHLSEDDKAALCEEIPLRRAGRPEEVAAAVRFLAESPYITGETLVVSGGWR